MKKYLCIPVMAVICVGTACKKNKDDDKSRMELVTSAAWKYDKAMIDGNGDNKGDTDVPASALESCDTDNTITFKNDGTGVIDEGATKCSASDPQTVNFSWAFSNEEKAINIPSGLFPGFSGDVNILVLSSTKLQVQKVVTLPGIPLPVNAIVDFKH